MTTSLRTSVLAVAVAVIAAVTIGTVTGSEEAGAATQHTLRIPAAAFRPVNETSSFYNDGYQLWNHGSAAAYFKAPVILEGTSATIHSVKLHYYDNGPESICVYLFRVNLKSGGLKSMSNLCTRNAVWDFRTRIDTTIRPDTVGPDNATYLDVLLPPGAYSLNGVTIVYTSDL